jgi:hypothetical protein
MDENEIISEEDNLEEIDSEEIDKEQTENKSFEIISYGADYTLSVLYEKLKNDEIKIPEFQRNYVWKPKQASKLVESFLLGLPVPGIFLANDKESGNLLVVDGQQRLRTIKAFRDGKYPTTEDPFYLIEVQDKWKGKLYKDLEPFDRKKFDDSILRATIIKQIDPNDNTSIYHVFERLNTGGTILQNQEVRNCIYYGKFNEFLHKLNQDLKWRTMYNMLSPQKRRKDEELILRFFALFFDFENYFKPMNSFLSDFMSRKRNPSDKELESMKELFLETIYFIEKKIGISAFRPRRNLNIAAFDSIMYTVAKYKENLKVDIDKQILNLFRDLDYSLSISEGTTDPEVIKTRFDIAKRYLVENV